MKTGLFVDTSNLYYCIGKHFDKKKLDYKKYLENITKSDKIELQRAIAYGSQIENTAGGFINCLKHIGFETKYRRVKDGALRVNWNVGITIDVIQMIEKLDLVILGSADGELIPLVEYITKRGVRCEILACGINKDLKTAATRFIEIGEELLESVVL